MSPTRSSEALSAATLELIAESGIDALTLSQVAVRAGVSRATAYREFGDKDGLLSSVAQREIQRMMAETMANVNFDADPATAVPAVILKALHFLRNHAAFTYVRDHEPHWLLHAVLVIGQARMNLVETVAMTVAPVMDNRAGAGLALPVVQAAELIVRTVLSHTVIESSTLTDQQVAEAATRAIIAPRSPSARGDGAGVTN
ncbi:helix-turn-helix domain-containing protein [Mycobacterium syngnathidarum]